MPLAKYQYICDRKDGMCLAYIVDFSRTHFAQPKHRIECLNLCILVLCAFLREAERLAKYKPLLKARLAKETASFSDADLTALTSAVLDALFFAGGQSAGASDQVPRQCWCTALDVVGHGDEVCSQCHG